MLIDLDEPDRQPPGSDITTPDGRRGRRTTALWLVVSFVLGGVVGGFGVSQLRDSRDQRERRAAVALVALPESANAGGTYSQGTVQLSGLLMVINAGPGPITVRGVQAGRPGVTVRAIGQPRLFTSGASGPLVVELRLECSTAFQPEPLSMRFSVETEDKHVREVSYPVALVGSGWERDARSMCEHP